LKLVKLYHPVPSLYALTAQAGANAALPEKTCQWKGKVLAWKVVSSVSALDVLLSKE